MLEVRIDYDLCQGHQMCTLGCADVFVVGDDDAGRAVVTRAEQPDERLEELRKAELSCPEQAIAVVPIEG